jgi:hypothetical protein
MDGWKQGILALVLAIGCTAGSQEADSDAVGAGTDGRGDSPEVAPTGDSSFAGEARGDGPGLQSVCGSPALLAERTFRADRLEAFHPTDLLNEFFQQSADRFELVMVIRFGQYRADEGVLDATIGAATATIAEDSTDIDADADPDADAISGEGGGELSAYSWALEPAKIRVRTDGCKFEIEDEFDLDICASTASRVLALKRMTGRGTLWPDGSRLRFDDLAGFLPESEVEDLCIGMPVLGTVNFHWFMNAAGICPEADSNGDLVPDAYNFVGTVEALEDGERFIDEVSGPVFGVTDCPVNTEACSGR